jgi:hypothetical protein
MLPSSRLFAHKLLLLQLQERGKPVQRRIRQSSNVKRFEPVVVVATKDGIGPFAKQRQGDASSRRFRTVQRVLHQGSGGRFARNRTLAAAPPSPGDLATV